MTTYKICQMIHALCAGVMVSCALYLPIAWGAAAFNAFMALHYSMLAMAEEGKAKTLAQRVEDAE